MVMLLNVFRRYWIGSSTGARSRPPRPSKPVRAADSYARELVEDCFPGRHEPDSLSGTPARLPSER